MLLKTSAIALCSNNSVIFFDSSLVSSITSWRRSNPSPSGLPAAKPRLLQHVRRYAAVLSHEGSNQSRKHSHHETLPRWPTSPNPTPYEIFGLARDAPYREVRFYDSCQ